MHVETDMHTPLITLSILARPIRADGILVAARLAKLMPRSGYVNGSGSGESRNFGGVAAVAGLVRSDPEGEGDGGGPPRGELFVHAASQLDRRANADLHDRRHEYGRGHPERGRNEPGAPGGGFGTADDTPGVGWATDQRFALPGDVAPGASATVTVTVTAPASPAGYVLRHRMVKEAVAWFDQIQKANVTVSPPPALAASYASSPPTSWLTGQTQTYTITVTNIGTETWLSGGATPVHLGVHFGTSSDVPGSGCASPCPSDVASGGSVTITVTVTAPNTARSFVLRHRMVKEAVAWFDQIQKANVAVQ